MNKAKEILYKHAKSNGCESDLLRNPFLEQAVLNAINEALTIHAVSGRSEQLSDSLQDQIKRGELDPYSPHAKWIKP